MQALEVAPFEEVPTSEETAAPDGTHRAWSGVVVVEDILTGDGRLIERNALRWDLPAPLRIVFSDAGAHDNAQIAGRILSLEREDDGKIRASGDFDLGSEPGREAARLVAEGYKTGVSVDLDDSVMEVRVRPEMVATEDEEVVIDIAAGVTAAAGDPDNGERETVSTSNTDDEILVITSARIRAATLVDIPAFAEAHIGITDPLAEDDEEDEDEDEEERPEDEDETDEDDEDEEASSGGLTAAGASAPAAPESPPATWFADPGLTEPTPLTITDDGRVFGHVAAWGTCHIGFADQCVQPPQSAADYAYFVTGVLSTEEGETVPVGAITMDTLHAGARESARGTLAHYENTGNAAAFVAIGEDAHGIWCAGSLRPTLSADEVRTLKASPLSGDWREIRGGLELVGVLAVNVPGFPLPRTKALSASGGLDEEASMRSLVAAGMLPPRKVLRPGTPGAFSTEDIRYLKALAERERMAQADERAAAGRGARARVLAARVRAARFAR